MSQPQWKKKYTPVKLDHRVAGWGENWNTSWGRNHHLVTILAGVSIQLKYIILVVKIGLFLGSTLQKSEPLTYYRSMLKNLNYSPGRTVSSNPANRPAKQIESGAYIWGGSAYWGYVHVGTLNYENLLTGCVCFRPNPFHIFTTSTAVIRCGICLLQ